METKMTRREIMLDEMFKAQAFEPRKQFIDPFVQQVLAETKFEQRLIAEASQYRKKCEELQAEVARLKSTLGRAKIEVDYLVEGLIEDKGLLSHATCSCCLPMRGFKDGDSVNYCELKEIVELISPSAHAKWEAEEARLDEEAYERQALREALEK